MSNNKSFWKDGLSIDESRISALIISYIISFVVTLGLCIYTKDIESLKAMFFANIAAITGINITNSIVGGSNKNNTEDITDNVKNEENK